MKQARILLAAPKSGSGKTTITCALLEALKMRGRKPRAFKSGPDYIDPMFHEKVIGVPSRNLDTFFSGEEQICALYAETEYCKDLSGTGEQKELSGRAVYEHDISVIEGAMGLYDGLGGIQEEGSAYHLAKTLQTPVILVLDAHGMGRSMVPVLSGLLQYDESHLIRGVILNRTSQMFAQTIAPVIEEELSLPVLGCFPVQKELFLPSRHLGLVMPDELCKLRRQLQEAAILLEKYVDLDRLLAIADEAEQVNLMQEKKQSGYRKMHAAEDGKKQMPENKERKLRLAIAQDEAFCFYYEDNLRTLQEAGITLVPFSPVHDKELPEVVSGLLLGGGYPELYAKELSENAGMRNAIREALAAGLPSVAECGGFMYLHRFLADEKQNSYELAGAIDGTCQNTGKLVRFGYVKIREQEPCWLPEHTCIKGHEFHYYDSTANGCSCIAQKPVTGRSWQCIHTGENFWWGYPHLYYPSNPHFVDYFTEQMRKFQESTPKMHNKSIGNCETHS